MIWILNLLLFSFSLGDSSKFMSERENRVKAFLKTISQVESSGGKNFNHPEMESGIHAGQAAIGRYGLMPNTVNEVLNRMRLQGTMTPELQSLSQADPNNFKEILETNPQLEDQIAEALATRVLTRQPEEEMAAYSWNQGHNLRPEQIAEKPYLDSDYVKKYNYYKNLPGDE